MIKKQILTFFIGINALFLLLILVNCIPYSAIAENVKESAEELAEYQIRTNVFKLEQSKDDVVTDSILLNIISHIDGKHVIQSTLESAYYLDNDTYPNSLLRSIEEGLDANEDYARYWHGSTMLFRFLLLFLNRSQIKMVGLILYIVASLLFCGIAIKKSYYSLGIGYVVATAISTMFFGTVTVGYLWAVLIPILGGCYILQKEKCNLGQVFLILGIAIAFFDFLTIETLSLTLPLICYIYKEKENMTIKKLMLPSISWLCGYAGTFLYKWILASIVCGKNYITGSFQDGVTRAYQEVGELKFALKINIKQLFSFVNSMNRSVWIYLGFLLVFAIVVYLLRKENMGSYIFALVLAGAIPYVRYFLLSNHSSQHYFFTYRAQFSTILAMVVILLTCIDTGLFVRRKRKR